MEKQNFKNHKKYVIGYHFITFGLAVLLLVLAVYNLISAISSSVEILTALMFFLSSVLLLSLFLYSRAFALKAQDRAIRAEENLRYYILTGKVFDSRITIPQILALRFAPDDELIELTRKAVSGNMNSAEIKKTIVNWKGDHYRV